jgi:hypothetical protein
MFMPFEKRFYQGDKVKINKELSNSEGTFTKGHTFTIIQIENSINRFIYCLMDTEGNKLCIYDKRDISLI